MSKAKLNYQLNLCTSKDVLRFPITNIYVTKESIFATDSHILTHLPTNYLFDEASINNENWFDFYIPTNQYKMLLNSLCKLTIDFDNKLIKSVKNNGVFNASFHSAESLEYPKAKSVINLSDESNTEKNSIDINIEYLTKANKALDINKNEGVKIVIKENKHYYIHSREYRKLSYDIPFALIMGMNPI